MVFDQTGQQIGRHVNYGAPVSATDAYIANLERCLAAVTALARELAVGVHQDALHAPDWSVCDMAPCVGYRAVLEGSA